MIGAIYKRFSAGEFINKAKLLGSLPDQAQIVQVFVHVIQDFVPAFAAGKGIQIGIGAGSNNIATVDQVPTAGGDPKSLTGLPGFENTPSGGGDVYASHNSSATVTSGEITISIVYAKPDAQPAA